MRTPLVLVVEADPTNLALATELVRLAGCRAELARTGVAARTKLRTAKPDLVLLDIDLGGEDGIKLLRDLRAFAGMTAVVALSVNEERKTAAFEAGCAAFLAMPYDIAKLKEVVHALVCARAKPRRAALLVLASGRAAPSTRHAPRPPASSALAASR